MTDECGDGDGEKEGGKIMSVGCDDHDGGIGECKTMGECDGYSEKEEDEMIMTSGGNDVDGKKEESERDDDDRWVL